jgi:hypothetical protein
MMSAIQKTVKALSGNLRRLQLSVALIALSFLCKAFLYVTLAFLFGLPIKTPVLPTDSTAPFVLDCDWCFFRISRANFALLAELFGGRLLSSRCLRCFAMFF